MSLFSNYNQANSSTSSMFASHRLFTHKTSALLSNCSKWSTTARFCCNYCPKVVSFLLPSMIKRIYSLKLKTFLKVFFLEFWSDK